MDELHKILNYLKKSLHFDVVYTQAPSQYGGLPSGIDIKGVDLSLGDGAGEAEFIKALKDILYNGDVSRAESNIKNRIFLLTEKRAKLSHLLRDSPRPELLQSDIHDILVEVGALEWVLKVWAKLNGVRGG